MIAWMFLQPMLNPRKPTTDQRRIRTESVQQEEQPEISEEVVTVPQGDNETQVEYQDITASDKVIIKTNYYEAELLADTATISSWKLNNYLKRDSQNGEMINLIPPPSVLMSYKHCSAITFPNFVEKIEWYGVDNKEINLGPQEEQASITFKGLIEDKLRIAKRYTFHQDSYAVDLEITFENLSDKQYPGNEEDNYYILRWGPGITSDDKKGDKGYGFKDHRPKKSSEETAEETEEKPPIVWVAMHSRYFTAAIIPAGKLNPQYEKNGGLTSKKQVDYVTSPSEAIDVMIPGFEAGEQRIDQFTLYIGPKDDKFLKVVQAPDSDDSDEPIHLNKIIKLGWFSPLAKGLLWLLNVIYAVTSNYGVSIIIVATLLKVLIYPLTRKGHQSMRDMQKLKEPLEELKEKYRDDPQKLNKATMRLYKEHGVNPLSGCIVHLPQMPILFAFFSVLREVIELRGAGFVLWITDLSVPDTLWTIPINIPIPLIADENGLNLRILPLLMGAAMYFQQKLTGSPGVDSRQSKMMAFMPIIMTFFFYGFPSGLVLYWLWNNLLTIAQQYMITKRGDDTEKVEPQTKKENKQKREKSDFRSRLRGVSSSGRKGKKKR